MTPYVMPAKLSSSSACATRGGLSGEAAPCADSRGGASLRRVRYDRGRQVVAKLRVGNPVSRKVKRVSVVASHTHGPALGELHWVGALALTSPPGGPGPRAAIGNPRAAPKATKE